MTTETPPWETATGIAERWERVTVPRVRQFVSLLGLTCSKKHCRMAGSTVEYSPAAVGLIEREIRSRGHRCTRASERASRGQQGKAEDMSNTITIRITGLLEGTALAEMAAEHPAQILDVRLEDLRELVAERPDTRCEAKAANGNPCTNTVRRTREGRRVCGVHQFKCSGWQ